MPPTKEKSQLKRERQSEGDTKLGSKKPRRSERLQKNHDGHPETPDGKVKQDPLPSPVTNKGSTRSTEMDMKDGTMTPMAQKQHHPAQQPQTPRSNTPPTAVGLSSPPDDTQAFSQFIYPPKGLAYEVEDEEAEGVWGYLIPAAGTDGDVLVLRKRAACPVSLSSTGKKDGHQKVGKHHYKKQEEQYEERKADSGVPASGYLIGRHQECDRRVHGPNISNRHCLFFSENKGGSTICIVEDLSQNGTYVNDKLVGRNQRRELNDGDEISILDAARYLFRYPRTKNSNGFHQQYTIQEQLGKGHFATVYLCVEKSTGIRYAVKKFEKRPGSGEKSKADGLQQEVAVLMGVSHANVLCLKDTFDESDGMYLVLELAPEGELFNWIVMKHKLSEAETRKVFIQLFQGIKYLIKHERSIVHRDIKPENILLVDKDLHVKLADFGLAKIIGEESFTTTLCGTPSYVAPEILQDSSHRRYTRAVDVWSLGVVLYICLCGFPPFSDELYDPVRNPYTLSMQIKEGRFDYPSPYWDSVGDEALDLIDRMLTVDVNKRITVDECLEHPWVTQRPWGEAMAQANHHKVDGLLKHPHSQDSTFGLTEGMHALDFSKRKPVRERTMLCAINDVRISRVIDADAQTVKVFEKNKDLPKKKDVPKFKELRPEEQRNVNEFIQMGGQGDQPLFGYDGQSIYEPEQRAAAVAKDEEG